MKNCGYRMQPVPQEEIDIIRNLGNHLLADQLEARNRIIEENNAT